ncbi:MAG TPA: hypothetical protein VMB80_08090 [Candidatus Acidoferrum sp.]|nr:hypothetical protein [Candidatus Acidoferrum sp.]
MRTLVLSAFLLAVAVSASAHKDRIERPREVAVSFKTGERVIFAVSNTAITAITVRVGTNDHTVPPGECAKLQDVHFETVTLLWNGSYTSAAEADYFYLQFDMGAANAKVFDELPRVQLMFRGAKYERATITKKVGKDSWQDSKL